VPPRCPPPQSPRRSKRREIESLLNDAPSLKPTIPDVIQRKLIAARGAVIEDIADRAQTPRREPATLSFTPDQVLGPWLPD